MAERWLTVAGVADHLAVSRDTVESLIRGADLVAVDVSPNYRDRRPRAAWRVSPADLEDFLATRRTGVAATPVTRPARRRPKGDVVEFV
ncbi:MAG: helix-turn-helix domain-containing protein [Planctomycetota bacterium]|nr:helix-turn-helix domain-containing protein [Planctomycetota bacterium]